MAHFRSDAEENALFKIKTVYAANSQICLFMRALGNILSIHKSNVEDLWVYVHALEQTLACDESQTPMVPRLLLYPVGRCLSP